MILIAIDAFMGSYLETGTTVSFRAPTLGDVATNKAIEKNANAVVFIVGLGCGQNPTTTMATSWTAYLRAVIRQSIADDVAYIDLDSKWIGDEGIAILISALERIPNPGRIKTFYLGGNGIGTQGAIALAGALVESPHLSNLKVLELRMNDGIGHEGKAALTDALAMPHLSNLRIIW